jgi:hypothetical protein
MPSLRAERSNPGHKNGFLQLKIMQKNPIKNFVPCLQKTNPAFIMPAGKKFFTYF